MRAWVKLKPGCEVAGLASVRAEVSPWGDSDTVVWLKSLRDRDGRELESQGLLVPLSSIAWLVPVEG